MNRSKYITLLLIAVCLQTSCASRYRLDLLMDTGHGEQRARINGTQVVLDAKLNQPYADEVIGAGSGAVLLVSTETRGAKAGLSHSQYFGFDEVIHSEVYFELDYPFKKDSIDLKEHSMVKMLGHYSWPEDAKVFLPEGGYCLIDSISSDFLYATATGSFVNNEDKRLSIDGRFRARIQH